MLQQSHFYFYGEIYKWEMCKMGNGSAQSRVSQKDQKMVFFTVSVKMQAHPEYIVLKI
jgi:hypothetical protein